MMAKMDLEREQDRQIMQQQKILKNPTDLVRYLKNTFTNKCH